MDETKSLTTTRLEPNQVRRFAASGLTHLSPEKEGTPFLLYLLGDDTDTVAFKSGYPKDIIDLTAIHYQWERKRDLIKEQNGTDLVLGLQKNLVNLILVATYTAMRQELTEVLSGKKDAEKCLLIPKTIHSLNQLIELAQNVNKGGVAAPVDGQSVTNIQTQNVQIIEAPAMSQEEAAKRILEHSKMLELLAGKH